MATRFSATARAAAIGLVGGALAAAPAGAAKAAARSEPPSARAAARPAALPLPTGTPAGTIPVSVADPDTAPRPVVTVAIGGVPLLMLLDTGSTGIRVASDKIPGSAVAVTGAASPYGYGSGIQLHGDQADADVAIGSYHTGPLPIELVRSTDCFADKPDCPAAHGAKPAMFGGVLDGIMGVSPEEISGLVNPLWSLQDASGHHIGFPAFTQGPIRFDLEAGTVGFPVAETAAPAQVAAPQQRTVAPVTVPPAAAPAPAQNAAPAKPVTHTPAKRHQPAQPFHETGRKARSLPDTGVPLSAALGAVTALTALLAGIGTVLAARRRTDHEARR